MKDPKEQNKAYKSNSMVKNVKEAKNNGAFRYIYIYIYNFIYSLLLGSPYEQTPPQHFALSPPSPLHPKHEMSTPVSHPNQIKLFYLSV